MQTRIDIGQLLDTARWSGYSKWLVSLVALAVVFDGIDNQLLGIAIPAVMAEWGVARSAFAAVVSLALLVSASVATLIAMSLPYALQRLGRDPAFGSGPLATVIQDLLSIAAYLAIATALL